MEDARIVDLYWARSETAITETSAKYGSYCYSIAYNILSSREDADEAVNDTYMDAWDSIPPHRPTLLSTFLGKITRRLSIDRWRISHAQKRGSGEMLLSLEELGECISSSESPEGTIAFKELVKAINLFLACLSDTERDVFVSRYWFLASVKEISNRFDMGESRVKTMPHRTRRKLQTYLQEEGYR